MAWGDCWGERPCRNARELAEAFYTGRERKIGKHCVKFIGLRVEYLMYGHVIASRIPEENIPELVRRALVDGQPCNDRPLEFCWQGMPFEKDVARHLRALGVPGVECARHQTRYQDQRFAELCGKPVEADRWYTLEEAAASTLEHPVPVPRQQRREGFVNRTLPLFA